MAQQVHAGVSMKAHIVVRIGPFQALKTICCVWAGQLAADGAASVCSFGRAMLNVYVFLVAEVAH